MQTFFIRALSVVLVAVALAAHAQDEPNAIVRWHLEPFWHSPVMHGESVFFLEPEAGAPASADLLFTPEKILSVVHPATGATYEVGRDFTVDVENKRLTRTPDSRLPFTTRAAFEPALGASGQRYRDESRDIFFGDGAMFHLLQVEVTYEHAGDEWTAMEGPVPASAAALLPRVDRTLRAGEPLRVCLLGDSISFGLNASGTVDAPPHQPPYGTLFTQGLTARYGSPIDYTNFSISGMSTPWGIEQAAAVAEKKPDLVLIAFGMNDASGHLAPEVFAANIEQIVQRIRALHAPTEFVLVATMRGNAGWKHSAPELYPQYRDALLSLQGPGVAVADVTAFWTTLLEHKKFADITGNGVNHPNDFGHRVYAQVLLALFGPEMATPPSADTPAAP